MTPPAAFTPVPARASALGFVPAPAFALALDLAFAVPSSIPGKARNLFLNHKSLKPPLPLPSLLVPPSMLDDQLPREARA